MIFKIEEFAVFDGPGIRAAVFFKGCPLRCTWCHNPEGLSFTKERMISVNLCIGCGRCREVCPHPDNCIACGQCLKYCPRQARQIAGSDLSPGEIAEKVAANGDIYRASGGGVTFSGGEPLAQPRLLMQLIDLLTGLHKAIETSGYADPIIFQTATEALDLVIMDIKLADDELHRRYTGVSNERILSNLEALKFSEIPFWIRVPLIPGVTDTEENMVAIAGLLKGSKGLERVELMPYNRAAGAKYPMAGRDYKPGFDAQANPKVHLEPFEKLGIKGVVL